MDRGRSKPKLLAFFVLERQARLSKRMAEGKGVEFGKVESSCGFVKCGCRVSGTRRQHGKVLSEHVAGSVANTKVQIEPAPLLRHFKQVPCS